MQTVLAFVVALGILVVVHELGHYAIARACGVKVIRFSVGFGRVIWSRRFGRDQTEWAVSLVPLGGYVSMLDERETHDGDLIDPADLPRAFNRQPVYKRIAIVIAGPIANLLLAIALYTGLNVAGVEEPVARLGEPTAGSFAANLGLVAGDRIVSVDTQPVRSWIDMRWQILKLALDRRRSQLVYVSSDDVQHEAALDFAALARVDPDSDFLGALGFNLARSLVVVNRVEPQGEGNRAGLKPGDVIEAVGGKPLDSAAQFVAAVRASANHALSIDVRRAGERLRIIATPDSAEVREGDAPHAAAGRLGIAISGKIESTMVRYDFGDAISNAASRTWEMSTFSLKMLGRMVAGEVSLKNLSGPVTIADYAGQSARIGLDAYVAFVALISISLGVLNLLPIPMLDGGHLLYYLAELARGKPLPERVIAVGQRLGLAVLVTLMAVALFNDFTRLFT